MEILKTTVGHHLVNLFPENIAFSIATFLEESTKGNKSREEYETFYRTLLTAERKGKIMKFLRYSKHLRYGAFGVYSYDTEVIELNWKQRTAKRLGRWSPTTRRHMNYAIRILGETYDFKEIK